LPAAAPFIVQSVGKGKMNMAWPPRWYDPEPPRIYLRRIAILTAISAGLLFSPEERAALQRLLDEATAAHQRLVTAFRGGNDAEIDVADNGR
jgi:hypothetical protein